MTKSTTYIINEKGEKTGVILGIDKYEEMLEDLHDLRVFEKRKNNPTVPWGEVKNNLKQHGKLSNQIQF